MFHPMPATHNRRTTPGHLAPRRRPGRVVAAIVLAILSCPAASPLLRANTAFTVGCREKECSSCQSSCQSTCRPEVGVYDAGSRWALPVTFSGPDSAALEAARAHKANMEKGGKHECQIVAKPTTVSKSPGGNQPAGVNSMAYDPTRLTFDGVTPDYVVCGTHPVTGARMPRQFEAHNQTVDIRLSPDGRGYEICAYPTADLPAPGADRIRVIPPVVLPDSTTTYRNPNPDPLVCAGDLDIVHSQRHPETGVPVTHCVRVHAPADSNEWRQDYFDGDPGVMATGQPPPMPPYKSVAITRRVNADGTETTTEVTRTRARDGQMAVTSERTRTHAFHKNNFPVVTREDGRDGRGGTVTTGWTYHTDPANPLTYNKPATMRRSDGSWANYGYQGSEVTGILITKTTTGIGDAPAPAIGAEPDPATCRVVTEIEAKNETGTFGREEKVGGVIVSKTWGERAKAADGTIVETSHRETGGARLTTIRSYHADADGTPPAARARLKSVVHPDGTREACAYALEGRNLVVTTERGVGPAGGAITTGTRERRTCFPGDMPASRSVTDIATSMPLHEEQVVATTPGGCPKKTVYGNDPSDYTETSYGCCGIDAMRARDGTRTTYINDALKRPALVTTTTGSRVVSRAYDYAETGGLPATTITTTAGAASGLGSSSLVSWVSTVKDLAGRVVSETTPGPDGTPETTTYTYSADGIVTTRTNPDGGTIITETHADGRTKSITGTATIHRHYTYGVHNENGGGVTESVNTANGIGGTTRVWADLGGRIYKSAETAPHGQEKITVSAFDSNGRLVKVEASGEPAITYEYDAQGRTVAMWVDRNGDGLFNDTPINGVQDFARAHGSGYVAAADAHGITGPALVASTSVRTAVDNHVTTGVTALSVDGLRRSTRLPGVANPTVNISGRPLDGAHTETCTLPDGTSTVSVTTILPGGHTRITHTKYSNGSSPGPVTSFSIIVDALGRTIRAIYDRGQATDYEYHGGGGLVKTITRVGARPGGGDLVTAYSYAILLGQGRRTEITPPDGSVCYREFNMLGKVVREWGSQANPVRFTYDAAGRLATHTTFRAPVGANTHTFPSNTGDTATWVHDPSGVLLEKIHADGNKTTYTYDIAGRLATSTGARGITTSYGYTAGQLSLIDYSDATPDVVATYNRLGQLLTASQSGAATAPDADYTFGYHPDSLRFASETVTIDPDGTGPLPILSRTIDRSRDHLQRPTGFMLGNEHAVGYGYDVSGRLAGISAQGIPNLPGKSHAFEYTYEPGSSLLDKVTGPVHDVDNDYEPNRNVLLQKKNTRTIGTPGELSVIGYTVNAIGQREQRNLSGEIRAEFYGGQSNDQYPTNWGYDALGQVTSEDKPSTAADRGYSYDQIGNRLTSTADSTTTSYSSNPLNQYTSILPLPVGTEPSGEIPEGSKGGGEGTTAQPAYDQDGNMTTGLLNGSTTGQLEYDGANQLIRTQSSATSDATRNAYDAFGRRIAKATYPNAGGAATSATVFIYDGWNLIAEYKIDSGAWTLDRTYTWGIDLSGSLQGAGGVGGLLATCNAQSATPFYPIYDGNGNIEAYLDSNGSPAAIYQYDAFGNVLSGGGTGAAIEQAKFSHRFSSKYQDAETGLLYYGYRYLNPTLGRWMNPDPLGEFGGIALYGFVSNDPNGGIDILGLREPDKWCVVATTDDHGTHQPTWKVGQNGRPELLKQGWSMPSYHFVFGDFWEDTYNLGQKWEHATPEEIARYFTLDRLSNSVYRWRVKSWNQRFAEACEENMNTDLMVVFHMIAQVEAAAVELALPGGVIDDIIKSIRSGMPVIVKVPATKCCKKVCQKVGEEAERGGSSLYDDVTRAGSRVANRATDVTKSQFEKNLIDSGFTRSLSKDGKAIIFEKDGARYILRDGAKSTGGPTADFYKSGSTSPDLKIRLEQGAP